MSTRVPLAILLGGIVLALALYATSYAPSAGHTKPSLVRPVRTTDHILGNPAAPVMIVEYSDFDCEYCKDFNEVLHQIIANEGAGGKVAWVFRQFPLTEIHPTALAHARASECAAQVSPEAFWKFAQALYAHQPVSPGSYGTLAKEVGIAGDTFANCYAHASETLDGRIEADRQNALDMGAIGTPYSVLLVSGRPPVVLEGAYSYDALRQIVREALGDS